VVTVGKATLDIGERAAETHLDIGERGPAGAGTGADSLFDVGLGGGGDGRHGLLLGVSMTVGGVGALSRASRRRSRSARSWRVNRQSMGVAVLL